MRGAALAELVTTVPRPALPKFFYRIGDLAALAEVKPHVIRYWETEFPAIRAERSKSGQRVWSRRGAELVLIVRWLLHVEGYTIAGAKRRLERGVMCPHCGREPVAAE